MTNEMATEKQMSYLNDLLNAAQQFISETASRYEAYLSGPEATNPRMPRKVARWNTMSAQWTAVSIPELSKTQASQAIDLLKHGVALAQANEIEAKYQSLISILNS